jgi:hypothetical protein
VATVSGDLDWRPCVVTLRGDLEWRPYRLAGWLAPIPIILYSESNVPEMAYFGAGLVYGFHTQT